MFLIRKVTYRSYAVDDPRSHVVVLLEILAAHLKVTREKTQQIQENFMLCAHDAHETLVAFTKRLLQTTCERQIQDVGAAVVEDSELTSHVTSVFTWPSFFDLSLGTLEPQSLTKKAPPPLSKRFAGKAPSSTATTTTAPADLEHTQAAPETPPDKTRRTPESAETTPLKRPRFRTTGEAATESLPSNAPETPNPKKTDEGTDAKTQTKWPRFRGTGNVEAPQKPAAKSEATTPESTTSTAASTKATMNAAAAQKRLDEARAATVLSSDDAAASKSTDVPPTQAAPAMPNIDRNIFGSMLKRRRFNVPEPKNPTKETQGSTQDTTTAPPESTPQKPAASSMNPPPPPSSQLPPPASQPPPPEHAELDADRPYSVGDLEVHYDNRFIVVNDMYFHQGTASGAGCNCLIDTLRQLLRVNVNIPEIRRQLQLLFPNEPDKVKRSNFLDFQAHGPTILRLISEAASRQQGGTPLDMSMFQIVCVDLQYVGNGDIAGNGRVKLFMARERGCHFIPLRER